MMKKLLKIAGCAIIAAVALAGCGGSDDSNDSGAVNALAGTWSWSSLSVTGGFQITVDKAFLQGQGYQLNYLKVTLAQDGTISGSISGTNPENDQPLNESTSLGTWSTSGNNLIIAASATDENGQPVNVQITLHYAISGNVLTLTATGQELINQIPNYNELMQQATDSGQIPAAAQLYLNQLSQMTFSARFTKE